MLTFTEQSNKITIGEKPAEVDHLTGGHVEYHKN